MSDAPHDEVTDTSVEVDPPRKRYTREVQEFDELPPYIVPHSQEPIRILYSDDDLLIVDKPCFLLSTPGRHPVNRDSMISRLRVRFPGVDAAHRLDLDTSGLLIVPKHKIALAKVNRLFQERAVSKEYRAVVWGCVEQDSGEVDLPIARDWVNRPKQKICAETGKPSLTKFEVLARGTDRTLLRLLPITGRSHQLRIHMRELGHPIMGCDMYAHDAAHKASERLLLHATRIAFTHPSTGATIAAYAEIPTGMRRVDISAN